MKDEADPRTVANALLMKESRETYYGIAREFLVTYKFATQREYAIWEGHCNGLSFRKMAATINSNFYKVRITVNKLQKLAGLKK